MANINAKYGGEQRALRDSVMAEECLGPGNATMYLNGGKWSTNFFPELTTRIMDWKPKIGEMQSISFAEDTPPPFYDWEAPAKDTKVQKAKGKTGMKEGYVRKANGTRQALWERGWYVDGMSTITKDAEKTIGQVLGNRRTLGTNGRRCSTPWRAEGTYLCCRQNFTGRCRRGD